MLCGGKFPILRAKLVPVEGLETYLVIGYYSEGRGDEVVLCVDEDDPEVRAIVSEFSARILPHIKVNTARSQDLVTS